MAEAKTLRDIVSETALTTPIARKYFEGRISAPAYRGDVAMETVCYALFDKRLQEGESIRVQQKSVYYSGGSLNLSDWMDEFRNAPDGSLYICSINVSKNESGNWKAEAEKDLEDMGYFQMKDIEMAMSQANVVSAFWTNTRPDAKTRMSPFDNTKTIVLMENINMSRWHTLCMLLVRLLGKWFANPLTAEEKMGFQASLREETSAKLLEAAQAYADTLDFRGQYIRDTLGGIETRFAKERTAQLENECQRIERDIEAKSCEIGRLIAQKEEAEAALWGFQMKGKDMEPVTMNMFLANKNLVLRNADANSIEFYVSAWLEAFDPDKARSCFKTGRMDAWLEYNNDFGVANEDAELLYKAIFLEETCKVMLWSHYTLYLRNNSPIQLHGSDDKPAEIKHALPNPHHRYNTCFGGNTQLVNDAMRSYNVVAAIAQCQSATMGINLTEHASYKYFSRDLFDPRFGEVVWVCDENKWMTTKDAIAYLKTKKEEGAAQ